MFISCYMDVVFVVVFDDENVTKKRFTFGRKLREKNQTYMNMHISESSLYIMHASTIHTEIVPSILYIVYSVHQYTSLLGIKLPPWSRWTKWINHKRWTQTNSLPHTHTCTLLTHQQSHEQNIYIIWRLLQIQIYSSISVSHLYTFIHI